MLTATAVGRSSPPSTVVREQSGATRKTRPELGEPALSGMLSEYECATSLARASGPVRRDAERRALVRGVLNMAGRRIGEFLTPLLRIVQRVITGFLRMQSGFVHCNACQFHPDHVARAHATRSVASTNWTPWLPIPWMVGRGS